MAAPFAFLVTCEHGGNRVPAEYRKCFAGRENLLKSHRGYDPGALTMARDMARRLDAPLMCSTISRLLVDLNRSPGHPRLHAEPVRTLPASDRSKILKRYYLPFRTEAESVIQDSLARGRRVIHLSSHSFTPVMDGVVRRADVSLLYDPARSGEAALCKAWLDRLAARNPELRLRRNYPYRGTSDGFTAYLRRCFGADHYIGIEVEINQRIPLSDGAAWRKLRLDLIESLIAALEMKRVSG